MTNPICVIQSCSSLDNVDNDVELLSISTTVSNTIYPLYVKFIIDNTSSQNTLQQITINLKSDEYSYSNGAYLINSCINVIPNNVYTVKAKVFFSDGSFSNYSQIKVFTASPSQPEIISAYGDSVSSIFLSITPQMEVSSYTVILAYIDLNNIQQLDILDNISCTDNTKQFIELTNLQVGIQYNISLIATNLNGQSKISNTVLASCEPKPDAPTTLTATFDSNADITLSWVAPNNIIHLPIDHYIIEDGSGNQLDICPGNLTSYTFSQPFAVNQSYSFQIIAVHIANNVSYNSDASNIATVSIPEPSEIQNLQSSFDKDSLAITLTWDLPANNNIISTTSYNISVNNGPIQNVSTLSFIYSLTSANSTYSFTIVPLHASYPSNDQSVSINVNIPLTGAPTNFSGNFDNLGNITLVWLPPNNNNLISTTSYNVYNNGSNAVIGTTTSTSFFIPNQLPQSSGFHVNSVHGLTEGNASQGIIINIPSPSMPLNLSAIVNATSPPTVSLSWDPPANNNTINTTSYNVYQNGLLVHNVIQTSYNSDSLISGNSYTYVVKPVIQTTEINSPASITIIAYQASQQVATFSSQSRNNSVILNWSPPLDNGGASSQYYLIQLNQNTPIQVNLNSLSYTFNNLVNGTSYNFSVSLITSPDNGTTLLNGQIYTISASPSGLPIINSISLTNNTLTSSISPNGSNLLANYEIISFDANNVPTISNFNTPSVNVSTGLVSISQNLPGNIVKASLIVANSVGLVYANTQ